MASYLFYRWALVGVSHWGELVKSAFDCYLPELATQLGFELPETEERRRRFWTAFSLQITYGRNEDGKSPFNVHEWIKPQSTDVSAEHKGQKKPAATKIEKEKESEKNKSDDDDDEDDDG